MKCMKKIIAFMMTVTVMAVSTSTAFAADKINSGDTNNTAKTEVQGKIKEYIDVEISWGDMEFTFTPTDKIGGGTWDWTANNGNDQVTVVNRSTVAINAGLTFTPNNVDGATIIKAASADFRMSSKGEEITDKLVLAAGNASESGIAGNAYLYVKDGAITSRTTIGQITVTVEKQTAQ